MSSSHFTFPGLPRQTTSESQDEDSHSDLRAAALRRQGEPILLGDSVAIRRLRSQIQRIAPHFRSALIRGEVGTGKQFVANAIHALSPGAEGPFIVSDAAALAESVAGGDRASTPNTPAAGSLLESAQGGTLYLKGVGKLTPTLQAALLRFLRACEERRAAPIQSSRSGLRRPDIRILASSDRDLRTLASVGQFRQDLHARLSVVEILVPPLRQRTEDFPVVSAWLLRKIADCNGQGPKMLAENTLAQLQARLWSNNFRELERVLQQAAALAEGAVIEPRHLLVLVPPAGDTPAATARIERLHEVIQQHVLDVLTRCGGNKLRTAELLGISRSTLYRMLDASTLANSLPE